MLKKININNKNTINLLNIFFLVINFNCNKNHYNCMQKNQQLYKNNEVKSIEITKKNVITPHLIHSYIKLNECYRTKPNLLVDKLKLNLIEDILKIEKRTSLINQLIAEKFIILKEYSRAKFFLKKAFYKNLYKKSYEDMIENYYRIYKICKYQKSIKLFSNYEYINFIKTSYAISFLIKANELKQQYIPKIKEPLEYFHKKIKYLEVSYYDEETKFLHFSYCLQKTNLNATKKKWISKKAIESFFNFYGLQTAQNIIKYNFYEKIEQNTSYVHALTICLKAIYPNMKIYSKKINNNYFEQKIFWSTFHFNLGIEASKFQNKQPNLKQYLYIILNILISNDGIHSKEYIQKN